MKKLYRRGDGGSQYWEAWDAGGSAWVVHWGNLGTYGMRRTIRKSSLEPVTKKVAREERRRLSEGFRPIELGDHDRLIVEYRLARPGSAAAVEKRHRLEERLNEELGWTGLGHCDGGSIGGGTYEAACYVVDYDMAVRVVTKLLEHTEFADYACIYRESAE